MIFFLFIYIYCELEHEYYYFYTSTQVYPMRLQRSGKVVPWNVEEKLNHDFRHQ